MKNKRSRKNCKTKNIILLFIILVLIVATIFSIKIIKENTAIPVLQINGETSISLNLGDIYEEQGAVAKIGEDEVVPEIIGDVDTSVPGEYIVRYVVSNKKGRNTIELERKIIVKDNIAPTIKLEGDETIKLTVGNEYKEEGVTATDNIDGDITERIITIGKVDTSKAGTYEIQYSVKDTEGNTATAKRKVIVSEKPKKTENINSAATSNSTSTSTSTSKSSSSSGGLPVLMYHFFYDKNVSSGKDNNWMEISDFESQIKYLSENNFYYPTWQEVEDYIDGKIELPEKSVVITVDDGDPSFFELAVPIIQKYNVKATSFVVTSWYGYRANSKEANISYQSHSDCMHIGAENGKGVMLSWSYEKIFEDVKQSSKTLGGATVFCYPFGQYNNLDKKVLKDAGYKLAFTTQGGRVYKGSDKYALPRVRMSKGVSLKTFATMVN